MNPIGDVLRRETIDISGRSFDGKGELFPHVAALLCAAGVVDDSDAFVRALFEREETGPTYMGDGIAVPHGKSSCVRIPGAAIIRCRCRNYEAEEESAEVDLCVALAIPENTESDEYIRTLADLSRLLLNDRFHAVLMNSKDVSEIVRVANEEAAQLKVL